MKPSLKIEFSDKNQKSLFVKNRDQHILNEEDKIMLIDAL